MNIPSQQTFEYPNRFEFNSFFEALERGVFPIFATHWPENIDGSDHSIVILWPSVEPHKFVVFDKWG